MYKNISLLEGTQFLTQILLYKFIGNVNDLYQVATAKGIFRLIFKPNKKLTKPLSQIEKLANQGVLVKKRWILQIVEYKLSLSFSRQTCIVQI